MDEGARGTRAPRQEGTDPMNGLRKTIMRVLTAHAAGKDEGAGLADALVAAIEAEFAVGPLARRVDQVERVVAEVDSKLRAFQQRLFGIDARLDGHDDEPEDTSIESIRAWVGSERDGGKR